MRSGMQCAHHMVLESRFPLGWENGFWLEFAFSMVSDLLMTELERCTLDDMASETRNRIVLPVKSQTYC